MNDVILFGLGAIGSRILRVLEDDYPRLRVVGAVDYDVAKAGKPIRELVPHHRFGDVVVTPDLTACLKGLGRKPEILLHLTESKPERIGPQLIAALDSGLNVLSAAESMFYPALRYPNFARDLDTAAKGNGVTISGCGINPGFSYDILPLVLARATSAITSIAVRRCIDVTGTGPGDIEHVGYGLTPEVFRSHLASGKIVGHMGAPESVTLLAEYLDMQLDLVTEAWDIETAKFEVDSGDPTLGVLPPGRVIGITQSATGSFQGREVITTRLAMYYEPGRFGLEESDIIEIDGAMPVHMTIRPAVQSLFGAANVITSAIANVASAPPGLAAMLELPLAAARRGTVRYQIDPARSLEPGRIPLRAA